VSTREILEDELMKSTKLTGIDYWHQLAEPC